MICTAFIATSLDGFIARLDGGLDWLSSVEVEGQDYGFAAFMKTVDALVMGRKTFEIVRDFPEWPYGEKTVAVLTQNPQALQPTLPKQVIVLPPDPEAVIAHFADQGAKHLYIDGGQTIRGFLARGHLNRLIISRIPILLGQGIPLFGSLPADIRLQHTETVSFPSGLVQSTYEVLTNPDREL